MDNRRSRVVINSKFQYQYALLAASLTVLLINLFILINAVLPTSAGFPLSTEQTLWLAIIEVIFIGGVWWGSLIASHKIAGPVYVIVRQMEKLAEGDLTARVRLRKRMFFRMKPSRSITVSKHFKSVYMKCEKSPQRSSSLLTKTVRNERYCLLS